MKTIIIKIFICFIVVSLVGTLGYRAFSKILDKRWEAGYNAGYSDGKLHGRLEMLDETIKAEKNYIRLYPEKRSEFYIEFQVPDDLKKCIESIKANITPNGNGDFTLNSFVMEYNAEWQKEKESS